MLSAMGFPDEEARGALRLSLGRTTTAEEIVEAVRIVPPVVERMRAASAALDADPLGQSPFATDVAKLPSIPGLS